MQDLTLTSQQAEAKSLIEAFLKTPGSGVFILKGYAGTGKTTLLQQLGIQLKKEKENFVLLAPTGRAASVLKAKTGLATKTVHSELYHFTDIDGEVPASNVAPKPDEYGQMRLLFNIRQVDPEDEKLYIVDEASMISDEPGDPTSFAHFGSGHLLSDLLSVAGNNKIIFSGDPSQLPPVGCEVSPALNENWFIRQGKSVQSFEMNKILRQKENSEILQLATKVRGITERKQFPKWIKIPASQGLQVKLVPYSNLKDDYVSLIKKKGPNDIIGICHSNSNCLDINKSVRSILYGNPYAELVPGDLLMVTQNNHLVPLSNGDFVTVVSVGMKKTHQNIHFQHVAVESQLTGLTHEVLLCLEPLYNGQANLTNEQQRMLMISFSMRMRQKKVSPKSPVYYEALQKDPYLNSLRANFGYAVTCHKSQGGEWSSVYFFLHKGMYTMNPTSLSRWWYTGITRAKEELYLANDWWIG